MRKLRLSVGFLGLILPFLLFFSHNGVLLSSMSHYYYTSSSIFFIGIVFSFAIVLFSYQGYKRTEHETFSDNSITSLAALFALITVIIPTASRESAGAIHFFEHPYLFGYKNNNVLNILHLLSAGLFISLLGYMSYFKFTRSPNNTPGLNRLYKTCGLLVWFSIAMILIFVILKKSKIIHVNGGILAYYVWWFEFVAIEAFSIAWIVKSKPIKIFTPPNKE